MDKFKILKTIYRRHAYNFLEDVDLVEKHSLLILVHVALSEDLDGSLGIGFSVDAHTHLSEGTYTRLKY